MRPVRTVVGLLALLLLALPTLTGCSQDEKPAADVRATLLAAKKSLDTTSGVHIGLATPRLPRGVDGLLSADGVGTHAPAFKGSIKVSVSGVSADAAVIATGGTVYAKLPFTVRFAKIDPASYGAPDPADLLDDRDGLSSLLTAATDVKQGKRVRDGKAVLTSYTAKLPGTSVASVIPSASTSATFDATFTIDDQDRLAKAVLTGPFYPKADDVTYTITFDDYGTTQDIAAP